MSDADRKPLKQKYDWGYGPPHENPVARHKVFCRGSPSIFAQAIATRLEKRFPDREYVVEDDVFNYSGRNSWYVAHRSCVFHVKKRWFQRHRVVGCSFHFTSDGLGHDVELFSYSDDLTLEDLEEIAASSDSWPNSGGQLWASISRPDQ